MISIEDIVNCSKLLDKHDVPKEDRYVWIPSAHRPHSLENAWLHWLFINEFNTMIEEAKRGD